MFNLKFTIMTILVKGNEFELVRAKKSSLYCNVKNAIEKANYVSTHNQDTYEFHCGGYIIEEYTYIVIDTDNGFCLNKNPMTYTSCIELIRMYL